MGFIVEKQVDFPGGINLDSFYVRIESYVLNRAVGQLDILIGHYTNQKGAELALPKYVEDIPLNNASATLPYEFSVKEGSIKTDRLLSFSLTGSSPVTVEEHVDYQKTEMVDQEIVDYDDEGNEIIGKARKLVKMPARKITNVLKTKVCDIDFKETNLIDYAYSKVKNIYNEKFGSDNIKDL